MKTDTSKGNITSKPELSLSKRKHFKKLVLGAGTIAIGIKLFPETWTKPVINSVMLPVHAQTTDVPVPTDPPGPVGICSIVGPEEVKFNPESLTPDPAIDFTITNTGPIDLSNLTATAVYGGDATGTPSVNLNSPPNPLSPGASHVITIPMANLPSNCFDGFANGTLTIQVTFAQANCAFVSTVSCFIN